MYFMLECDAPVGRRRSLIEFRDPDRDRLWLAGQRFENPPTSALTPTMVSQKDSVPLELWKVPLPLMSKRLHRCMVEAGVSNLDVYPTVLLDSRTGQKSEDYLAFNIIGTIAAADLARSDFVAPDGPLVSVDFNSVAIDETKTRQALIFRLAEAVTAIVVHETVKQKIEAAGIDTLSFLDPSDWAG